MKLGRNLARTFLDFYKLVDYIPSKLSSEAGTKVSANISREKLKRDTINRSASEPMKMNFAAEERCVLVLN